jgi:putative nucleotidyltransferase with HDIG domain
MTWQKLSSAPQSDLIAWAESQPWCHAMADCQQDAEWHAEGDVWTHTKLVVEQLELLEEWSGLTDHDRTLLNFTALFHDIAKPITTEIDAATGRVSSPKHSVKGEHLARGILRDLECDLHTREEIVRLVRNHGRPAFLLDKESPTNEVIRLSWLVKNRLLYLFALADTRGRDTESMSRPEENLHYWKIAAEDTDCFDRPYKFANEQARWLFYQQSQPDLHYVPYEDFRCTVTMMSGLPGSGKDTWLQQHLPDQPVVALDEIRTELGVDATENQGAVAQVAMERCRELLRNGQDFTFNATNTNRLTRQRWIDLFTDYRARVEIVYIEPPFKQILSQNARRTNPVPEAVIRRLADRCEVPTWMECHCLRMIN